MRKTYLLATVLGAALTLTPLGFAQQQQPDHKPKAVQPRRDDDGVQAAIAFQRAKDRDDARQARLELRHPSVTYSNADRSMDESSVRDPGPPPKKGK